MADETLSLRLEFEDLEEFTAALDEANTNLENLSSGLGEAESSLGNVESDAAAAAEALDQLSEPVAIDVDSSSLNSIATDASEAAGSLEEMGAASEGMASDIESNVDEAENATSRLKDLFNSLPPAIQGIVAAFAAFGSLQIVTKFFETLSDLSSKSVEAFQVQETAVVRLGAALGSLGQYSQAALDDIQGFASGLQKVTTYGDETTIKVASLLAQLGRLSGDELKRATEATVQLSAVLGTDLNASALLVAKAAQGMTSSLSRYGIIIDESIPQSQKFAAVLDKIEQQFGGTAQLAAQTFGGKIQQLSNAWGDFLEVVGQTATVFSPAIQALTEDISRINDFLGLSADSVLNVDRRMSELTRTFDRFGSLAPGIFGEGEQAAQQFSQALRTLGPDQVNRAIEQFEQGIGNLEIAAKFALKQGDEDEIRRVISELQKLADEAAAAGASDIEKRIRALIELGNQTIELNIVAATTEARNEIIALRKLAAEEVVPLEVTLLDELVRGRIMELEKLEPEIKAEVDLDRKSLDALEGLEYDIKFRAPTLSDEQFVELATRARQVFIDKFNKGIEEGVESPKLDEAFALIPLLQELEKQRTARIDIEWAFQGPKPDWEELLDAQEAKSQADAIGKLILSTLQTLKAPDIEIIDLQSMIDAGATIDDLLPILEDLNKKLEAQVIDVDAARAIWDASRSALEGVGDKASDAAQAVRDLRDASREAAAVSGFWTDLLQELPGLADDMKNVSTSTGAVSTSFEDLDKQLEGVGFDILGKSLDATLQGMISQTDSATDLMLSLWRTFAAEVAKILAKLAANEIFGGGGGGGGEGGSWWQRALSFGISILPFLLKSGATGEETAPPPGGEGVTEFVGQVLGPRITLPRAEELEVARRGLPSRPADQVNISIRQFDTDGVRRSLSSGSLRREIVRLNRLRRM